MKLNLIIALSILLISCDKSDMNADNSQWLELTIPKGGEAYDIAGALNERLLVSTTFKTFYSDDKGITWNESYDFNGPCEFFTRNDTVFALLGQKYEKGELVAATNLSKYTTNYGLIWEFDKKNTYKDLIKPITKEKVVNETVYKLINNKSLVVEGSSSYYIHPSSIEKQTEFGVSIIDLIKPMMINNIQVDAKGYLYLAASSGIFDANNHYTGVDFDHPAKVYISSNPNP